MAQPSIVPMAKALFLCDGTIGFPNQKTDVMGLFTSIRPISYPHVQRHFVAFAQLSGGIGNVSFYFDVTFPKSKQVAHDDTQSAYVCTS
jgi:hypothetical protein